VARPAGTMDAWLGELERAAELFDTPAAAQFLTSPVVPPDRKQAALFELLPGLTREAQNFFALLARRGRLELIPAILTEFRQLVQEERGIETATVTTAVPIDDRQKTLIASRLTQRIGKAVQIETRVDPSILGGVVAQIGDDVIDGSVRGRLERLRRSLMA
jgi:F-type H+-transporting ATPase subunit delta